MSERRVNGRGFRVFAERERLPHERLYGEEGRVSVVESSIACRGAHVRIFECEKGVQLSVHEAEMVALALLVFVAEARADLLTESDGPAGVTQGDSNG